MRDSNGYSVVLYLYCSGCSVSNNIVKTVDVNILSLLDKFAENITRIHIVCTCRHRIAAMSAGIYSTPLPSANTPIHAGCPVRVLNELRTVQESAESIARHCSVYQNHFLFKGISHSFKIVPEVIF